ncbi:MAG TPA: hypothetical protein VM492_03365 [Sumerlaeia bacterium]|nr:hypothetical protein [Sumerlaeia bacterium]
MRLRKSASAAATEPSNELADFEERLVARRERCLAGKPFPYVRQTHMMWRLIGPFPNGGDTSRAFPPETEIRDLYECEGAAQAGTVDHHGGKIWLNDEPIRPQ